MIFKASPHLTLKDKASFALLNCMDIFLILISKNYGFFLFTFKWLSPFILQKLSLVFAKRAYYRAKALVPAYQKFTSFSSANEIPETDKENYVKKFSIEERCLHGKIPSSQVSIDESSGSTGLPYNWVRTYKERKQSHVTIRHFTQYCFGQKVQIVINAFSLGSWATGMNMGVALERDYIVKNTGPDVDKILHTMTFFGANHNYLILGYPPFVKYLIDMAQIQGFALKDFNICALVGGEGMSEELRDYLLQHFKLVYSGYGATDIEIGVGGETPLSVAIRRLARDNPDVKAHLFANDSRLPMLFQYNPLMHYIEVNDNGELIFTINRLSRLSPRIRYNLHDEGGVMRFDDMVQKLAEIGIDVATLTDDPNPHIKLPFVWIQGRKDFTISIMGANIYPEDVEKIVYSQSELAKITRSFCQAVEENGQGEVRPAFYFEVSIPPSLALQSKYQEAIVSGLLSFNKDFKEAWKEYPQALTPLIYLFAQGEGPFKQKMGQIKQIRMLSQKDNENKVASRANEVDLIKEPS